MEMGAAVNAAKRPFKMRSKKIVHYISKIELDGDLSMYCLLKLWGLTPEWHKLRSRVRV